MTQSDPSRFAIDLGAQFHALFGEQTKELRAMRKALTRPPMQPLTLTVNRSTVTPAANTNPCIIGLGGPPQGAVWDVMNLAISGLTTTTVVAGTADVFVRAGDLNEGSSGNATAGQIGVTGWRDQAATLPLVSYYSRRQIHLAAGQKLWIMLSAYSTSTEYVAQGEIEQFDDAAYHQIIAQ